MDQKAMVQLIRRRGVEDERVLAAMEVIPRHKFVPDERAFDAYGDFALPIGHQQTISQPYIVSLMTAALELHDGDRVLEIGTGSGYQAAVLVEMGMDVYTVERIPELYETAKARLSSLGYNAHLKLADGYEGWPDSAPYHGIIVTAAAPEIPEPLVNQLAEEGRMIIPVGRQGRYQTLWKIIKEANTTRKIDLGGVAFVPFISKELGTWP